VAWLADDAREGRGMASRGLKEAARYVAESFERAGLVPGGLDGSWYQSFEMAVAIRIEDAVLALGNESFERGQDFEAFLSSASGSLEAPVVFVGYGITDPESGWDDYAGIDTQDRIVLVLDDRPDVEEGPLAGTRGTRFLRRAYKVANARRHGAGAVLLAPSESGLSLPGNAGHEDANPTRQATEALSLAVSRESAERLVAAAGGPGLTERQALIDELGRSNSAVLTGVRANVSVRIGRDMQEVSNVLGRLPGSDPALADEVVLVGAHLDHLGHGEYGSLTPGRRGEVHNGADDNASGIAGLLELARALASGDAPRRSVLFAAFTAEEVGLVGSGYYVGNPPVPLASTVTMINLDMIGRLADRQLTVFGAESADSFEDLVRDSADGIDLELSFAEGAFGPSDQTSFHAQGLPVLFFFTGTHSDYHTPEDDVDRVDAEGTARVVRLVERVVRGLADAPERPEVVRAEVPSRVAGGERGYGPYLGTVPAFGGPPVRGVRLQAVRAGSPAEHAGLRGQDVIVQFTGAPVANLEEFAALLFGARAGERVEIVFERDGQRVETSAILGQRR
jgi:hypothetical protein